MPSRNGSSETTQAGSVFVDIIKYDVKVPIGFTQLDNRFPNVIVDYTCVAKCGKLALCLLR